MKLALFLEELEKKVPKIVHLCAIHMLEKVYDIHNDSLSKDDLNAFFTNYHSHNKYLNDYAGVIYNKFDSSNEEVYESLCHYLNENPDNKSLFEYRLTRINNQEPTKYLTLEPEMQKAAIIRVEEKIASIENSQYYLDNLFEAKEQIEALKQSLELVKRAIGID
ncbi:MAG: hypothetical protein WC141_10260 [Arcobacteraceae bacterium]